MSRAAVCVVVPVYNAAATLDRCVQSILTQAPAGGLQCVLVEDGSPDDCAARCDAWAAKDNRVQVLHTENRGVSAARNAGLAAAEAEFIAFVDADDALCPGALAAALAAQTAHPGDFVLWHYTTRQNDLQNGPAVTTAAATRPQSALARLWLDCLLAMPWNKLYRAEIAKALRFDTNYTLGEDLQFVLDYLAALQAAAPGFGYRVLQSALTYYDCSNAGGSLSTKYHGDYCELWPRHFAKLNAACSAADCPPADLLPLHRAELQVLAEGAADILRRDPLPAGNRRDKAALVLRTPWLRGLLDAMKAENSYSPYYLPCRWRSLRLVYVLAEAARTGSPLFGKLDWLGYYLLLGRRKRE